MNISTQTRTIPSHGTAIIKPALVLFLTLAFLLLPLVAGAFDFSDWDALLKKNVRPTTIDGVRLNGVDYKSVARDPKFRAIVQGLEKADLSSLKSKEEKLSFWINVYNIMAVKMVLDHYPVKSIKDAGSLFSPVWGKPVGRVAGTETTLEHIEHKILRPMGEPRIHVAIVCASVSCPDLLAEAYTPEKLEEQLSGQMKEFLQNRSKGLQIDGNEVQLSSIFKWFKGDFDSRGGVLKFIAPYAPKRTQAVLKSGKADVEYLDYNWDLNGL